MFEGFYEGLFGEIREHSRSTRFQGRRVKNRLKQKLFTFGTRGTCVYLVAALAIRREVRNRCYEVFIECENRLFPSAFYFWANDMFPGGFQPPKFGI